MGTSKYLKRITLSDFTCMMSMTNLVAISLETPSGCSLEKKISQLIHMNQFIVLYRNIIHLQDVFNVSSLRTIYMIVT